MSEEPFLDTNIFLRHLLGDDPVQSPRATAYLQATERGALQAHVPDIVILDCLHLRAAVPPAQKPRSNPLFFPCLNCLMLCFLVSAGFEKSLVSMLSKISRLRTLTMW